MNIIIAGGGRIGSTLARQLSAEGCDLTMIDSDDHVVRACAEHYDMIGIQGNCASMEVLRHAGVDHADLLIAVTNADELNLLCCTTAHAMNPALHTIARIRDPEYTEQTYAMRDVFGLSMAINPEKQAAGEIDRLILDDATGDAGQFEHKVAFRAGHLELDEVRPRRFDTLDLQLRCNSDFQDALERQKRIAAEPRQQAPHIAAHVHQRQVGQSGVFRWKSYWSLINQLQKMPQTTIFTRHKGENTIKTGAIL